MWFLSTPKRGRERGRDRERGREEVVRREIIDEYWVNDARSEWEGNKINI